MRMPRHRLHSNPRLVGAAVFLGGVYLAYLAGQWVLSGTISALALKIGQLAGIAIALMVLVRWRMGILLFLGWLTVEDLARKYMGNNMSVYFVKDGLLAVIYGAYFFAVMKGREKLFRPSFWLPLVALMSLGLAQVFNPRSTSLYYGLLGMKLEFLYVPLIFVGYSLLQTETDLDGFLSFNLKLAVTVALVGIIQGLGWRTFLNPASLAPTLQALGHLTRSAPGVTETLSAPPSVFVSQGRYANFLELMFTLSLGTLALQLFRRRSGRRAYLALGVLGVAIFFAGSKGALMYALITLVGIAAGLAWGARNQPWLGVRLGRIIRRGLVALAAGFCLVLFIFPNLTSAWGTYYYDMLWPESSSSELGARTSSYPLTEFEKVLEYADWTTGYGTGTASLGVQYVTGLLKATPPPVSPVENGLGDTMIELGVLGPVLWVLMALAVCISGWNRAKQVASTPLYPVALAIVWFTFWVLLPFTWASTTTYQNYVVNAYLWLLVGILFRLPSLAAMGAWRPAPVPVAATRAMEPAQVG